MRSEGKMEKGKGKPMQESNHDSRITTHAFRRGSLVTILLVMACGGCATGYIIAEGNYLTYDHPFTDAGARIARDHAEDRCRARGKVAVRTEHACSLTECTTSFQCMDAADAAAYQQ